MAEKKNTELTPEEINKLVSEILEPDLKHKCILDPTDFKYYFKIYYQHKSIPGSKSQIKFSINFDEDNKFLEVKLKQANYALKNYITDKCSKLLEEKNIKPIGWLTPITLLDDYQWWNQCGIKEDKITDEIYKKYKETKLCIQHKNWPSCSIIEEMYVVQLENI